MDPDGVVQRLFRTLQALKQDSKAQSLCRTVRGFPVTSDPSGMAQSRTKLLAKKLGLMEKIGADKKLQTASVHQDFDYVIVLDFEATCWKGQKTAQQEIIEFPAVLLNTSTGALESEFQQYVQPMECPRLSAFCMELTGITQDQVDNGVPLGTCLLLFNQWINNLHTSKSLHFHGDKTQGLNGESAESKKENMKTCAFATWTDWDLSVCLHYECRRKHIRKPPILNQWVDLKKTYKSFYNRKPKGLANALSHLGLSFSGREHCGLDDARNTAHLCRRMVEDGCCLKLTMCLALPAQVLRAPLPSAVGTTSAAMPTAIVAMPTDSVSRSTAIVAMPSVTITGCSSRTTDIYQTVSSAVKPYSTNGTSCRLEENSISTAQTMSMRTSRAVNKPSTSCKGGKENAHRSETAHCAVQHDAINRVTLLQEQQELAVIMHNGQLSRQQLAKQPQISRNIQQWSEQERALPHHVGVQRPNQPISLDSPHLVKPQTVLQDQSVSTLLNTPTGGGCQRSGINGRVLGMRRRPISNSLQPTAKRPCCDVRRSLCSSENETTAPCITDQHAGGQMAEQSKTAAPPPGSTSRCQQSSTSRRRSSCGFQMPQLSADPLLKKTVLYSMTNGNNLAEKSKTSFSTGANLGVSVATPRQPARPISINGGKVTPPLCACGKRVRRCVASNPGPNQGRTFYTCSNRRYSSGGSNGLPQSKPHSCGYFQWESAVVSRTSAACDGSLYPVLSSLVDGDSAQVSRFTVEQPDFDSLLPEL